MTYQKTSSHQFLQELRQQWSQNPVLATLNARLNSSKISEDVIQISENLSQRSQWETEAFNTRKAMADNLNTQYGALGLSGRSSLSSGLTSIGEQVNPDDLMFYGTLVEIIYSQDAPDMTPPAMTSLAADILRGKVDPIQIHDLLGSQIPGYEPGLMKSLDQMLNSMGVAEACPMLKEEPLIRAALSVPYSQIPELLADPNLVNPRAQTASTLLNIISALFQ